MQEFEDISAKVDALENKYGQYLDPKEIEKWLPDGFDINNATFVDGGDGSTAFGME